MKALRIARLLLGVSGEHLAREAGISTRELARIEQGSVRPHVDTLVRIDEALVRVLRGRRRLVMQKRSS